MNARHRIGQILTSLSSVAGIPVSILLLLIHVKTKIGDADGAAELCTASSTVDCSVAASSHYSEIAGIPIAAIGLAFYVAALLVGVLSPLLLSPNDDQDSGFTPAYLLVGAYTLALLDSVYLGIVNFTQLDKVCDKCVWLYGINLLGFVGAGLWAAGNPFTAVAKLIGRIPATLRSAAALVFVATFGAALAGTVWQANKMVQSAPSDENTPILVADPVDDSTAGHLYHEQAPTLGPDDAWVRIVEFSDFECPYCATFAGVVTEIHQAYPDAVQVTFRNYPLPFHKQARRVAEMAVCAQSQRKFWEFSNLAFARQSSLHQDFNEDALVALAEEAGLNGDEARDCLHSAFAATSVDQDLEDGKALKLRGTPTVYINEQEYNGRLDFESIQRVIDRIIKDIEADRAQEAAAHKADPAQSETADEHEAADENTAADADADQPADAEEDAQ